MTVHVFVGPSLTSADTAACAEFTFLPPAARGDIYRAALQRPRLIGLIDGFFEGRPAVWHKEILWAMAQGIHVFGGASMGALRAAELADFGMHGAGRIFAAYRSGRLQDDDEVAVVHGPAELDFRPKTEAMVNLRRTLLRARAQGVIGTHCCRQLIALAKGTYYRERTYSHLLRQAAEQGLSATELAALEHWLPAGKIDQKRVDALAVLEAMRAFLATDPPRMSVDYHFEHTEAWERATMLVEPVSGAESTSLLEELRLQGPRYLELRRHALLWFLVNRETARNSFSPEPDAVRRQNHRLRARFGLHDRQELENWLEDNDLDAIAYEQLVTDEASLEALEQRFEPLLHDLMFDRLRAEGDYPRLRRRAQDKQRLQGTADVSSSALASGIILKVLAWYFGTRLDTFIPDDIEAYAKGLGYLRVEEFYRALLTEYRYSVQSDTR